MNEVNNDTTEHEYEQLNKRNGSMNKTDSTASDIKDHDTMEYEIKNNNKSNNNQYSKSSYPGSRFRSGSRSILKSSPSQQHQHQQHQHQHQYQQ